MPIMFDARFVEIHRAPNEIEAHLIKGELEAAGISAHITDDSVLGVYPGLWWASPRIVVAQADAVNAAAIIREIEDRHKTRSVSRKSN
jgi:signal recognition particle subunit SEC65